MLVFFTFDTWEHRNVNAVGNTLCPGHYPRVSLFYMKLENRVPFVRTEDKPEETLVEARSGSDVQIDRRIWVYFAQRKVSLSLADTRSFSYSLSELSIMTFQQWMYDLTRKAKFMLAPKQCATTRTNV